MLGPGATPADYSREMRRRQKDRAAGSMVASTGSVKEDSGAPPQAPVVGGPMTSLSGEQKQVMSTSFRPVVMLQSWDEVKARSWNADDRFTIVESGYPEQHFVVTCNRHAGDALVMSDFQPWIRGG
jgi:hypothetical protein